MKTNQLKKESIKFNLEKIGIAKLKNLRSITGGNGDDKTVTDLSSNCNNQQGKDL
ncbi:hypothetical protein [Flavobacterium collinsii]|uniref:Natural product n=1 Tax=Flavobacterium collinsii TaxID=1114861 RepID=A0ABM8KJ85_9FLAO|nr:hypothetical protein [Flavobacterium collinsii]CAA9198936.1 hypothetical protein FLACOL7796_02475 [Flavobacterium collinsii]